MKYLLVFSLLISLIISSKCQIPSDSLALWFRADTGVVLSGNDVIEWLDLSGNGRNALTAGTAPQFVPNELAGKPVIRFNGINTYMLTPAFQTFANKRGTIFIIVKVNGAGNGAAGYGTFVSTYQGTGPNWQYGAYYPSFGYAFYDGTGGSNIPFNTSPPSEWGILTLDRFADDSISLYKSGVFAAALPINNNQPAVNTLKIGSQGVAFEVLNGDIAEIIIYNKSLSPTENLTVSSYLANLYDFNANVTLPIVTNQNSCASASFTLIASGGSQYRWYDSPSSISPLDTGVVFQTPILSSTDTFYVTNYNDTLESRRVMVICTINPLPDVLISTNNDTLCIGESTILSVNGALSYSWNTNDTDSQISVSPLSNAVYSVTGTDVNGCTSTNQIQIVVQNCNSTISPEKELTLDIFPNPFSNVVRIASNRLFNNATIILENSYGQEVLEYNNISSYLVEIQKGYLNSGCYILRIFEGNTLLAIKKLVIID